jgi:ABC-2 type transport system ATP-binding protein
MSEVAILLDGVFKYYNHLPVVNNLSLQIPQGEIFGLLGANGAGKSTTIRMLTTLTRSSQGRILINGLDVVKQAQRVKSQIGVVLQQISVDLDLTLWENMEYHGRLHHLLDRERKEGIRRCLDYVDLSDRSTVLARTLSGGMKRRLQIARALLHQPQVLFLDEPTVGLDPQTRRRLWEIIRDLKDQGMTILLTTHYMEEAEFLCDRLGIMNNGSLIEIGTPNELRQKYGLAVVVSQTDHHIGYQFFADFAEAQNHVELQPDKRGIMVRDSNLEDIFVELTGRKLEN